MRTARETVLQCLYEHDILCLTRQEAGHEWDIADAMIDRVSSDKQLRPQQKLFLESIVRGVTADRLQLDALIQKASPKWRIERMAVVDRNVLRMGAYELQKRPETGREIVLNEAVMLAKKFGSEESPRFVNGILQEVDTFLNTQRP